jgi:hypothetical protein
MAGLPGGGGGVAFQARVAEPVVAPSKRIAVCTRAAAGAAAGTGPGAARAGGLGGP